MEASQHFQQLENDTLLDKSRDILVLLVSVIEQVAISHRQVDSSLGPPKDTLSPQSSGATFVYDNDVQNVVPFSSIAQTDLIADCG